MSDESDDGRDAEAPTDTAPSIGSFFNANQRFDGVLSQFGFGKKYAGAEEVVKRGSREDRYQVDESYAVGATPTNHKDASFPCVKRTMYSFFQGTLAATFVSTPLSALYFAFTVAPNTPAASAGTAALLSAGAAGGGHYGLLYGFFMGGFRGSSCAMERFGVSESPLSVGVSGGIGGAVASVASARYRAPQKVAGAVLLCSSVTSGLYMATTGGGVRGAEM